MAQYRKTALFALRKKLVREYHMPRVEACELVDLVAWGIMTEAKLLEGLAAD